LSELFCESPAAEDDLVLLEEEEVPLLEEDDLFLVDDFSLLDEEEVPLLEEAEVPLLEEAEVPLLEEAEVPLLEEAEVPLLEEAEVFPLSLPLLPPGAAEAEDRNDRDNRSAVKNIAGMLAHPAGRLRCGIRVPPLFGPEVGQLSSSSRRLISC
jgi:hypothetical protein